MDVSAGDRGMARSDGDLMQIRDDILDGVKAFDAGPLVRIDVEATDLVAART
jgi:hypothetical protein